MTKINQYPFDTAWNRNQPRTSTRNKTKRHFIRNSEGISHYRCHKCAILYDYVFKIGTFLIGRALFNWNLENVDIIPFKYDCDFSLKKKRIELCLSRKKRFDFYYVSLVYLMGRIKCLIVYYLCINCINEKKV